MDLVAYVRVLECCSRSLFWILAVCAWADFLQLTPNHSLSKSGATLKIHEFRRRRLETQ